MCYSLTLDNFASALKMEETNSQDPKEEGDACIQSRAEMETSLLLPDKEQCEKGMSRLCQWLASLKEVREEALVKMWTGLFYCLLHAEKATMQEDLIDRMGTLLERLDVEQSLLFFKVFLTILRREWSSFDKDCVDRFYSLLRNYIFHMFAVLQKSAWDAEVISKYMDALVERTVLAEDGVVGDDVTVGITDVFLNELRHYFPIPASVFEGLLKPFWIMLASGGDNGMIANSITKNVFLPLFDHGCKFLASQEGEHKGGEEVCCLGSAALSSSFSIQKRSSSLLTIASEQNSIQLKLIQEKFTGLESLVIQSQHPPCDSSGKNCSMTESQSNGDVLDSLADSGEGRQSVSILPLQFLVTRTFGRRSKRNQKLVFSPDTVDSVYAKESVCVQEKPGIAPEDFPSQGLGAERGSVKDFLITSSQSEELWKGRTIDEVIFSEKAQPPNHDNGEIIDVDGSPPKQEATASEEEEDTNGLIAAIKDGGISMEDSVISNLTHRFESIAEHSPCIASPNVLGTPSAPSPNNTGGKKRKSWRCSPMDALDGSPTSTEKNNDIALQDNDVLSIDNIFTKKAKKVHFSLQHNIVWKPSTPLPPHSLRVPPSATPRGSALKKGVPPGPIVEFVAPVVSPKKKSRKKATPKKASSAHLRNPKSPKNTVKVIKPARRGRLSPC